MKAIVCLAILGFGWTPVLALGQDEGFGLVILRLQEPSGISEQGKAFPEGVVEEFLGGVREETYPQVVGLLGVRDAAEVEDLVWPLNRALGPNRRTYLTWLTGGGPQGEKMALLSLFPLVGFQDLFQEGRGPKMLYSVLDAPGGLVHVILGSTRGAAQEGTIDAGSVEKVAARVLGVLLKLDPEARVVLMGELRAEVLLGDLKGREGLECVFCPELNQEAEGVVILHPLGLGLGVSPLPLRVEGRRIRGVGLQWASALNQAAPSRSTGKRRPETESTWSEPTLPENTFKSVPTTPGPPTR